jgi:hypothetical protein
MKDRGARAGAGRPRRRRPARLKGVQLGPSRAARRPAACPRTDQAPPLRPLLNPAPTITSLPQRRGVWARPAHRAAAAGQPAVARGTGGRRHGAGGLPVPPVARGGGRFGGGSFGGFRGLGGGVWGALWLRAGHRAGRGRPGRGARRAAQPAALAPVAPVASPMAVPTTTNTPCPPPQVSIGIDPREIFKGADWALMVGAQPRGPGMERADLLDLNGRIFRDQGAALNDVASPDCKVGPGGPRGRARAARGLPAAGRPAVSQRGCLCRGSRRAPGPRPQTPPPPPPPPTPHPPTPPPPPGQVLVVGNPCNTNALIAMENAPRIPRKNFHALTRLDENRWAACFGRLGGWGCCEQWWRPHCGEAASGGQRGSSRGPAACTAAQRRRRRRQTALPCRSAHSRPPPSHHHHPQPPQRQVPARAQERQVLHQHLPRRGVGQPQHHAGAGGFWLFCFAAWGVRQWRGKCGRAPWRRRARGAAPDLPPAPHPPSLALPRPPNC